MGVLVLLDTLAQSRAGFLARYALASLVFVLVAVAVRRTSVATRTRTLLAASLVLLGILSTPLTAAVLLLHLLALHIAVERLPTGPLRSTLVPSLIALQAVTPIFWLPLLPGYEGRAREYTAFATNLLLLRTWGYAYDRLRRPEPGTPALTDFLLFQLFHPAFVNGPLLSHTDFARRRLVAHWEATPAPGLVARLAAERHACWRIARGIALAAAAMFLVCVPGTAHYDAAVRSGGSRAWPHALRVYLCWYLSFSAWTEIAIGFARLSGVDLPENFDNPSVSYGPADFWRRWNITLMRWLRNYVYLPLGGAYVRDRSGARRLEWRNTAAVFGFVAAYHLLGGVKLLGPGFHPWYSCVPWFLWALLNVAGVLATREWRRPRGWSAGTVLVCATTLAFVCVGHMTAMFPPLRPLRELLVLYRGLVWPF